VVVVVGGESVEVCVVEKSDAIGSVLVWVARVALALFGEAEK